MTGDSAMHIGKEALQTVLLLSAPTLVVATVVGFVTAMLQTITSIRDMTLGTVLKLVGVGVILLVTGNWMVQVIVRYTEGIFNQMQVVVP